MNLSEPFIRRPVMTTLVMLALLFAGIFSYLQLPVSNLPDVNYPSINVTAFLPGASPETMANNVATPMEKEFMTIPGITNVTSSNTLGKTTIVLQFDINKNIDSAAQDVQAAISRSKMKLPPNLPQDPTYTKVNPSDTPILYIALKSDTMTLADLYAYANSFIGQRISMIDGVAQVTTYGSPYAVRVELDPHVLASLNVTLTEVAQAVHRNNPDLPTGDLNGRVRSSMIMADGQLVKAAEYNPVVVKYENRAPVRIKDLGRAVDSLADTRMDPLFVDSERTQPTVVLAIQRQPGANTIKVSDAIQAFLPELAKQLPQSIEMEVIFDRSSSIKESIAEVKWTLVIAFLLVVGVIFLYLGKLSDTVIPSLVLPMSIICTFIVMLWLNFSIDNLSLLALTLAIGFIVDDAIVVLENIVRRIEGGESPWEASIKGSHQICFTIVSMTVSLAVVFIPMLFMGGLIGKIFREFSLTLLVVTLASGIISLTLTPMLCSRFIPPREKIHSGKLGNFSDRMNHQLLDKYRQGLHWCFARKGLILAAGVLSILGSAFFFKILPADFLPDDDIGFMIAFTQAAQGTSSDRMKEYQKKVMHVFQKEPNIENFISISSFPDTHQGVMFIRLTPRENRKSIFNIIPMLYGKLGMIPGVNTYLKNIPLIDISTGTITRGPYQYSLQSLNTEDLYRSAEQLIAKMRENPLFFGVTSDLEINNPRLNVHILRDQAATFGIDALEIEQALMLAYSGNRVSRIQTPVDQYDVILELSKPYRQNASALQSLYVRSKNSDKMVPLGAVATWKEGVGPASVNHISQLPAVTITFSVAGNAPLGTAVEELKKISSSVVSPDVIGKLQGAAETFESSIKSSGWLLVLAVLAIYVILGILYESFIHPLTILSTLPPAILGGLLTLYIFNEPLSLYAYLGLILLIGIVKKNGIMIVDYALDYLREGGEKAEDAIFHACLVRFRPIMMTTAAAVFGALPLAIGMGTGADARRSLGLVIIGGLLFSQAVTLFLTPIIYLYLEKWSEKLSFKSQSKDVIQDNH